MDHTKHEHHQKNVKADSSTSGMREKNVESHTVHQGAHEGHMLQDFLKRFWISALLTIPILALSHMLQDMVGIGEVLRFPGDTYLSFVLSTIVFFYGGKPFLNGLIRELKQRAPGMMTLIGIAISAAYLYSTLVVFAVDGQVFSGSWLHWSTLC